MRRLFKIGFGIMLFISINVYAQLPPNIGFEKGNFDGWECSIGHRSLANGDIMDSPAGPATGRHTLLDTTSKNDLDEFGHFPVLCPNGSNYSIKLGDKDPHGDMQRVAYTFKVPDNVSSYSIVFNYAVVLEDPPHAVDEQPLFIAKIYDVSDDIYVSCPSFNFAASSSLPGFIKSDVTRTSTTSTTPGSAGSPVYYKDWSTAMIDLASYAGKTIRLEFTSEDCRPNGHFGYAYLDVDEQLSLKPINGNVFCSNQTQTTLTGPTGFADYIWFKDNDLTQPGIHGQSITVPADDQQKYTLEILPYPDLGCTDYLYITLQKLPEPFKLVVADKVYTCPGSTVNLTAPNITAGSSSNMKFAYYKDPSGLEYLPNPNAVSVSGTYYIRGTNEGGCTDIAPVEVSISPPDITVIDPPRVQYPVTVELSKTFTHQIGYTYAYFKDAAAKIPTESVINVPGTFYIRAISALGCTIIAPVKVVIDPPPPYDVSAPSMFTPNGDGVNDNFSIKLNGYITFSTLNIFNRYGQKVFSSKSLANYWDGNEGAKQLPAGTYYWIFEGIEQYKGTKVTKAASITIVR